MSDVQILALTNDEYHARAEWSSSQLKLLPDEPELFGKRHIEKHPAYQFKPTTSTKLGTAVHDIVLEHKQVVMIPREVLRRQKKPKCPGEYNYVKAGDDWDAFEEEHTGSVLCKSDDPILHMVESIRKEHCAREWLDSEGPVEQSMIYHDEVSGLDLRARLDKLSDLGSSKCALLDVKSTNKDPYSKREIARVIYDLGYYKQAEWYWDAAEKWGWEVMVFLFVWVRNTPPYECHVTELDVDVLGLGRVQNIVARHSLAERLETNNWKPETFGRPTIVRLPEWIHNQEE